MREETGELSAGGDGGVCTHGDTQGPCVERGGSGDFRSESVHSPSPAPVTSQVPEPKAAPFQLLFLWDMVTPAPAP